MRAGGNKGRVLSGHYQKLGTEGRLGRIVEGNLFSPN